MDIENFIESQYREINQIENNEFLDLCESVDHKKLKLLFSNLHNNLINLFSLMNERLPTTETGNHFWADPSRDLIKNIEIIKNLHKALNNTKLSFDIDEYYYSLIQKCTTFLQFGGGSPMPPNMEKIILYYTIPIFKSSDIITTVNKEYQSFKLKPIGNGSYAEVFKYFDDNYKKI